MKELDRQTLRYSILDPTGNITALVESAVEIDRQSAAAAELMRRHPEVEQVGFMRFGESPSSVDPVLAELRMAGGEFCGNAAMCAAALALLRRSGEVPAGEETVRLRVSGAAEPVKVRLEREGAGSFRTAVCMPPALEITRRAFAFGGRSGELPLVCLEGIAHLIVTPDSPFFALKKSPAAGQAVRDWCTQLSADCLGLLFLEGEGPRREMTPLVFVPGSGTLFWESSCASGSAAVGMALAARAGEPAELELRQPGGSLRVSCDPGTGETWLRGRVRLLASLP